MKKISEKKISFRKITVVFQLQSLSLTCRSFQLTLTANSGL